MAVAISLNQRGRVLADCQAGHTFAAVARKYTVSAEWVRLFYRRFEQTGEVAARSHATHRQPFHVRHEAALRAAVAERPQQAVCVIQASERPAPEPRQPAESRSPVEFRMSPLNRSKKKRVSSIPPVPVTVRLKPEIAGALKRASLERQIAGSELFTRQDIVENLLKPCLSDQGYLD